MKSLALALLVSLAPLAAGQEREPPMRPTPARAEGEGPFDKLILRGATLIDGTGAPPFGPVDIVVEKNRITQVTGVGTPGVPINPERRPKGATKEIDVSGMWVLPGFIDLHVHSGGAPKAPEAEYVYKLWLAHGITSVRGVPFGDFDWSLSEKASWSVNRLTLGARNPDGTPAIDDNRIRNYSGKLVWQMAPAHKLAAAYNFDDKQRFHRRDPPPAFVEDKASLHQFNPAASGQIKYTFARNQLLFDSGLGMMDGETEYQLQKEVQPGDLHQRDNVRNSASVAGPRHQTNPNSRIQFDNTLTYRAGGAGGEHLLKFGVQYSRLRFHDQYEVNG